MTLRSMDEKRAELGLRSFSEPRTAGELTVSDEAAPLLRVEAAGLVTLGKQPSPAFSVGPTSTELAVAERAPRGAGVGPSEPLVTALSPAGLRSTSFPFQDTSLICTVGLLTLNSGPAAL